MNYSYPMEQHTTPLCSCHREHNAHMVDFCGWSMPLHYGSQVQEHHAVRQQAGMFDVSHMHVFELQGPSAEADLQRLLANDVAKLKPGGAQYSLLLNDQGGIIDDLIVYKFDHERYRLVSNACTKEQVCAWLQARGVDYITCESLAVVAVQGPRAIAAITSWQPELAAPLAACAPFNFVNLGEMLIARTGYTGEDGVEIMLPAEQAGALWQAMLNLDVAPCGLGARDTLRLEAGMCLSGTDMNDQCLPQQANLGWVVDYADKARDFFGRQACEQANVSDCLIGLMLTGSGVMRHGQAVMVNDKAIGEITSGGFSPTLACSIALARVDKAQLYADMSVLIRQRSQSVRPLRPPFVKSGKKVLRFIE
jgi:aminomethyltransferase